MLHVAPGIRIPADEIEFHAVRSQGAGGQNVNKVSSAVHLRFDIRKSSLPEKLKVDLLNLRDKRISGDGVIVIKAQRHRSQAKNRSDAEDRLRELVQSATRKQKPRKATRPTRASREKRLTGKSKRGLLKARRRRVNLDEH